MKKTYQVRLFKAVLSDFEMGWELMPEMVLFETQEYESPCDAMLEFDFYEPEENNWFVSMVERIDGEVNDEEIFDTSVIDVEYKELSIL